MRIVSEGVGCEVRADSGERLNQCDQQEIVQLVRGHGWVMFSGFSPSLAEFEAFTGQFGTCAESRTVHYPPSGEGLGFHAEDAYNPYRPDTIWFLCLAQGSDGGAPTGVVDGVQILNGMSPQWREFSRTNHLRFDRQWSAKTWRDAVGADRRDELEAVLKTVPNVTYQFLPDESLYVGFETPLVIRTPNGEESFSNTLLQAVTEQPFYGMSLGDGSPIPDELVALVRRLSLEHETEIGWQAGEMAVVNNRRMMHRRRGYRGTGRDLRARHCEDLFGTVLPDISTPVATWAKSLLQGDEGYPERVGRGDLANR